MARYLVSGRVKRRLIGMYEVAWMEIQKSGKIVTKRKGFKTTEAREKFVERLFEKGNLYHLIGFREPTEQALVMMG